MTTFRDILNKSEAYLLYIGYTIPLKNGECFTLRAFSWYSLSINEINVDELDSDSLCLTDRIEGDTWEIYSVKNNLIARMEEVVRENVEQCSVGAIRTMVQAKWRKWLI